MSYQLPIFHACSVTSFTFSFLVFSGLAYCGFEGIIGIWQNQMILSSDQQTFVFILIEEPRRFYIICKQKKCQLQRDQTVHIINYYIHMSMFIIPKKKYLRTQNLCMLLSWLVLILHKFDLRA